MQDLFVHGTQPEQRKSTSFLNAQATYRNSV